MTDTQRLLFRSSAAVLLAACTLATPVAATADIWTVIAFDARGDGSDPSSADAAQLSYRYDEQQDVLWFRVTLYDASAENASSVSIVVDTGAPDAARMNWWGASKDFRFDRLVTVRLPPTGSRAAGRIGVADAVGAAAGKFRMLSGSSSVVRVEGDSIVLRMKRTDLTDQMKMNVIGAVGSTTGWNDDIPTGRSVPLDLSAPRPARGLREIDLTRNNFRFPPDYTQLADNQPPRIVRSGRGSRPLILIPGVYSGSDAFDGFARRNESRYAFFTVVPPGLDGTPARPLPPESTSYGELTWTRRLARDVLDLIRREQLDNPVVLTHGFPGSIAAEELAMRDPEVLGGIIHVASMPAQFFPSPKDPTGKTPATPEERVQTVNDGWAARWFKYVTPETWESNNYPTEMFSNDASRAERTRQQVEAAPLQVKIRYLAEFMASDHRRELAGLAIPVLVLRPGFDEKVLSQPAHSWFRTSFLDSWDAISRSPQLQLRTIENARALMLDDRPDVTDEAIAAFVEGLVASEQKLR